MIAWKHDVAEHDYEAAFNYLSLRFSKLEAEKMVHRLRRAKVTKRRANDILRACKLAPLGLDDLGVRRDFAKAASGEKLSPVLVVDLGRAGAEIADGFHRVSLSYQLDAFSTVPLRLA